MSQNFTVLGFNPSESGWVFCTLTDTDEWDVYALLGWADIEVDNRPFESFKTVVPVPVGPMGHGGLDVMYEPTEQFSIYYAPEFFNLAQAAGSMSLTTLQLKTFLASKAKSVEWYGLGEGSPE